MDEHCPECGEPCDELVFLVRGHLQAWPDRMDPENSVEMCRACGDRMESAADAKIQAELDEWKDLLRKWL